MKYYYNNNNNNLKIWSLENMNTKGNDYYYLYIYKKKKKLYF